MISLLINIVLSVFVSAASIIFGGISIVAIIASWPARTTYGSEKVDQIIVHSISWMVFLMTIFSACRLLGMIW